MFLSSCLCQMCMYRFDLSLKMLYRWYFTLLFLVRSVKIITWSFLLSCNGMNIHTFGRIQCTAYCLIDFIFDDLVLYRPKIYKTISSKYDGLSRWCFLSAAQEHGPPLPTVIYCPKKETHSLYKLHYLYFFRKPAFLGISNHTKICQQDIRSRIKCEFWDSFA
jgi:hypothetical protein